MKTNQSVNDFIEEIGYDEALDPIYGGGDVNEDAETEGFIFNEDFNERLKTYNARVPVLEGLYQMVKPLGYNVIVRVFCNTGEMEEGKISKIPISRVNVPTASGYGKVMEVASPFPYKSLGVIVAKGPHVNTVEVGDVVQLHVEAISVKAAGQGNDVSFYLPYQYVHPTYGDEAPPVDPMDKHYGYLMIPLDKVIAIIP